MVKTHQSSTIKARLILIMVGKTVLQKSRSLTPTVQGISNSQFTLNARQNVLRKRRFFLHWDDDIDLDSLLGDYTCSEIELTDDDEPSTKKEKKKAKKSEK